MSNDDLSSIPAETYWQGFTDEGTPNQSFCVITGEDEITLYQSGSSPAIQGRGIPLAAEQNVTVYANRVYFPAGTWLFPGQTITIHAREIGTVGTAGAPAILAVDGSAGGPPDPKVPNSAPPGANGTSCSNGEQPPPTNGGPGAPGQPGTPGHAGIDAGSISIHCYAVLPNTNLQLSAVGGSGGEGQDGQDGTNGGQGGGAFGHSSAPAGNGGVGGGGGNGGTGGAGGAGGTVELFCVTQLPSDATVSINTQGGTGGAGGPGGTGGAGGPAGVIHSAMPGYPGRPGPAGSNGDTGLSGNTGQAGTAERVIASTSFTGAAYATGLNPSQCEMATELALLRYLAADGSTADPDFALVYDTFAFYAALYDQACTTLSDPLKSILAQAGGYVRQLNAKLDVYGRPYNYVPLVSYAEYDELLDAQVGLFTEVETAFSTYFANLQVQETAAQQVQGCITSLSTVIADNTTKATTLLNEASELVPGIEAAETRVLQAQTALELAFADLQNQIESDFSCSWANTLQVLAMGILSSGSVTVSSAITTALRAASSYNPNVVPVGPGGSTSKAYLVNQVQFVESDLQSIKEGYQSVSGLITEDDPNGARLLQLESQFNALYTQYFSQWGVGQEVEKAFTTYVQAVQYRNQLISNYNDDYTQACTLWNRNQALQQLLQVAQDQLTKENGAMSPEVVTFMSHAYHQARGELIHNLYLTSRAQQFWAVAPVDGLRALIGLEDPSQITAATLGKVRSQLLSNFETAIGEQGQVSEPFSGFQIVINDSDTLAAFQKKPELQLPISPVMVDTPASPGQPFAGLANVRLTTVRVYAEGARTQEGTLRVSIMHGGYETIVPKTNAAMSFIHNPLNVTFEYDLAQPCTILMDGTIGSTMPNDNFALIGPFTTWTFKVDPALNPGLDLGQITGLTIEFSGTASSF